MYRVLITGAAGTLGTILRKGLHGRLQALRLLDIAPLGAAQQGEELPSADIRDLAAVIQATADVDAVVQLAGSLKRQLPVHPRRQRGLHLQRLRGGPATPRLRGRAASSVHVTGLYPTSSASAPRCHRGRTPSTASVKSLPSASAACTPTDTHLEVVLRADRHPGRPFYRTTSSQHLAQPPRRRPTVPPLLGRTRRRLHHLLRQLRQPARLVGHHSGRAARLPPPRQRRVVSLPPRSGLGHRVRPRRRPPRRRLHSRRRPRQAG